MALPNVRMLARSHGWDATLEDAEGRRMRLQIEGVDLLERSRPERSGREGKQ